jgi:RNA polymerase-binding transcription factor
VAARFGEKDPSLAKKTKKTSTRRTPAATKKKASASKAARSSKKASTKAAKKVARKTATKSAKAQPKKTAKAASKKVAKKTAKKTTKKVAAKSTRKAPAKPTKKVVAKKSASKKPAAKVGKKTTKKPVPAAKVGAGGKADAGSGDAARKGITVVNKKPMRKKKKITYVMPDLGTGILGGGKRRKPVIASGPKNVPSDTDPASQDAVAGETKPKVKSPFNKKKLMRFREILLRKRSELVGDVSEMEKEALLSGGSGGLSHTPSHMAEQGSDTYDQALSLNIASVDRKLIKEIDDALARIDDKTYGVCELTGQPIREERLEELPWARHSIDAARELERRSMRS